MYLLIIGANSDIGKAIAVTFASKGFNIYLAARNCNKIKGFSDKIQKNYKVNTEIVELNILHYKTHQQIYNNLRVKPIGMICVVGYLFKNEQIDINISDVKKIFNTNLVGCISIINIVASDFSRRKEGFIIGVSSVAGERGRQSNYHYGSAKAGFTCYLDGLRNRLHRDQVNVITVKPGYVKTKMTSHLNIPNFILAEPEEIAQDVYNGWSHGKNIIYTRWYWKYIMFLIRNIPEYIFKRTSL